MMSAPLDPLPQPAAAAIPSAKNPPQRRLRGLRPLTWLLLLAIIGSCALVQAPREIGRWHLAAALNLRSNGQKDAAYQELDAAIAWFPKSPELLLQRAEWHLEDGQREEALADADRMLELGSDSPHSLQLHAQLLQTAGEFARAVEDWKKIEQMSQRSGIPRRETALNGLAYAQALAKIELSDALHNVNQALKLEPGNPAFLDTRGYILHLQNHNDDALADMDQAVQGMDALVAQSRRDSPPAADLPREGKDTADSRPKMLRQLNDAAQAAAVIHYHRALVLAALDRNDEAEKERGVVRRLIGREPDETLF